MKNIIVCFLALVCCQAFIACSLFVQTDNYSLRMLTEEFDGNVEQYEILIAGEYSYSIEDGQKILRAVRCENFHCNKNRHIEIDVPQDFYLNEQTEYRNFQQFKLAPLSHVNAFDVLGQDFLLLFADENIITHIFSARADDPVLRTALRQQAHLTFDTLTSSLLKQEGPFEKVTCEQDETVAMGQEAKIQFRKYCKRKYISGFLSSDKSLYFPQIDPNTIFIGHVFTSWPIKTIKVPFEDK